ncbi:hypothetical protein PR202_ga07286 [Eleusine coracana subsp. coracana]|uniref:non-specific serine/threonine protein kinase n=1 Tax=Eleusine coracana subsp. coracana TaxID=191504 RepID=A0AAV5BY59_ELECO|nr:hypothetical protein QOZ80_2AG0110340 [Eleusine coracana subsp. coracana]GJM90956.1 hypothetical protein PR202_ga07286 [Eleusine coracana subsp. coracana]
MVDSRWVVLWLLFLFFSYGLLGAAAASAGDGRFLYSGFAGSNLDLDGTATVTPRGKLQLTNGTVQLKGHAFHPTSLRLRRNNNATVRSFSSSFVFGILPAAPGGLGGHGIALIVAPRKDFPSGIASQYMGFLNKTSNGNACNHIFAVELDTILNPDFHDLDNNHVGVDINNLTSVEAATAGYYDDVTGEFRSLTLISGEAMRAWVDYDGAAKRVDVTLAPAGVAKKPRRPLVSATVDLSTVITDQAYIGFSSSTGTLSTRHYVLGWSFGVDEPAPELDVAKLPKLPPIERPKEDVPKILLTIALPVVSGALTFAMLATCVLLLLRRRYRYVELREDWEIEFGAHRLSHKDLFHATHGFNPKNLLGAGGFGRVYKGVLPNSGTEVAVKRVCHESRQGMKEFVAEVASIGRLRHRNLVQLLGYCRLKDELLLVYDYMPNGSLDKFLYNNNNAHHGDNNNKQQLPALSWAQRFQIIKGVASGLLYLHEEWEQVVVHRDVKPSNVLLDAGMNARLGDFGLARLRGHGAGAELQTTVVAGTFGYIAPELALTGKASPLTDVFAFGAFLLEVVTGRRPIDDGGNGGGGTVMLIDWVFEHWRRETLVEVVDPGIITRGDQYDVNELSLALKVGLLCSQPMADMRPSMRQVMQYLQGDASPPDLSTAAQHMGLSMLALLQNQGFDSYVMSSSSSSSSSMKRLDTSLSTGR